ncbi:hypothetical protein BaRGS_00006472 [Batillaria attramentaria]|uniref:Uncharacterized protein n=1 Tax=Batillaria attramentaria TaxID=370345 RepID=A0ABD0LSF1_9CAEN
MPLLSHVSLTKIKLTLTFRVCRVLTLSATPDSSPQLTHRYDNELYFCPAHIEWGKQQTSVTATVVGGRHVRSESKVVTTSKQSSKTVIQTPEQHGTRPHIKYLLAERCR